MLTILETVGVSFLNPLVSVDYPCHLLTVHANYQVYSHNLCTFLPKN